MNILIRRLLLALWFTLTLLAANPAGAASFDGDVRAGQFAEASALLSQLPPGGPDRGQSIDQMLTVLPLLAWSPQTAQMWDECMTALETETNSYWGLATSAAC